MQHQNQLQWTRIFSLGGATEVSRFTIVWITMSVAALIAAPVSRSSGEVILILLATAAIPLMMTNLYQARLLEDPRTSLTHLVMTFIAAIIAIALSLTINWRSGLLILLAAPLIAWLGDKCPRLAIAAGGVLSAWWVWLALDSWHWSLFVLAPLFALWMLSMDHTRETYKTVDDEERILPERAQRAAVWVVVALSGVLLILTGFLVDGSRAWLALAGIVLAGAIPLEAGLNGPDSVNPAPSERVITTAFVVAGVCWLAAIA